MEKNNKSLKEGELNLKKTQIDLKNKTRNWLY